jgi:hypothetical protein
MAGKLYPGHLTKFTALRVAPGPNSTSANTGPVSSFTQRTRSPARTSGRDDRLQARAPTSLANNDTAIVTRLVGRDEFLQRRKEP